ncbi:MAG: ribulose-phosphate 3-epimerase [Anaerolineae bacterium]|nr:ribulose-phosphate 3-epimerase [Anaerolineae bacterium]
MPRAFKIAPSILSADFTRLGEQVRDIEAAGAELIHVDIMDGHFVPNISFGPMVVEAVRRVTKLPLDTHLMIEQPERYLKAFVDAGATMLTVHVETCPHLHRSLSEIKALGIAAGVALNPHTPFEMIRDVLAAGVVDRVLVMTVNPGFGGQSFLGFTLPKVAQVRRALREAGRAAEIAVDGGVDPSTAPHAVAAGADVLVAGNALFRAAGGLRAGMQAIQDAVARSDESLTRA